MAMRVVQYPAIDGFSHCKIVQGFAVAIHGAGSLSSNDINFCRCRGDVRL